MAFEYHLSHVTEEYDHYISNIHKLSASVLWIRPISGTLEAEDLLTLAKSFLPLRCIACHIYDCKREIPSTSLSGEIVASTSIYYPAFRLTVRSDIFWLAENSYQNLSAVLKLDELKRARTMAFIPKDLHNAKQWADLIQGMNWLWLGRRWIATSPEPMLDAGAVVLSCLKLTLDIDGVPGLLWVDSDMNTGLAFFGNSAVLSNVCTKLQKQKSLVGTTDIFAHLCKRGFSFEPCR